VPILQLEDCSKQFDGIQALKDVTMGVETGSMTGIIGPNGAGKTTVFNLVTGLYRPTRGTIRLDGRDTIGLPPNRIAAAGVARTFQNIRLFTGMSVIQNVATACARHHAYGFLAVAGCLPRYWRCERAIQGEAAALLERLGLWDLRGERPGNLPYGLQRRLEIARALALKPRILLLDEPGAGLNPGEVQDLIGLIREIAGDFRLTVVLIEHRMEIVMTLCDRIHVLDFGRLIASGTVDEIRRDRRVIDAYLGKEYGHA
jgi:branched-chain amino acid transport system ATP-binding protein